MFSCSNVTLFMILQLTFSMKRTLKFAIVSVCLSVCLTVCLSGDCLSSCLSVCLTVCLPHCLSVLPCIPHRLSDCPSHPVVAEKETILLLNLGVGGDPNHVRGYLEAKIKFSSTGREVQGPVCGEVNSYTAWFACVRQGWLFTMGTGTVGSFG